MFLGKLSKISSQCGKNWSPIIQPTVLKMNSTHKRAIGTRPFNIMFGRQSRYIDLLEYVQVTDNENYNNEEDIPDADEQATFNVQNEMDNQMLDFNTEREDSWNEAR